MTRYSWAKTKPYMILTSDDAAGGHGGTGERIQVVPAVEDVAVLIRGNGDPRRRRVAVGLALTRINHRSSETDSSNNSNKNVVALQLQWCMNQ